MLVQCLTNCSRLSRCYLLLQTVKLSHRCPVIGRKNFIGFRAIDFQRNFFSMALRNTRKDAKELDLLLQCPRLRNSSIRNKTTEVTKDAASSEKVKLKKRDVGRLFSLAKTEKLVLAGRLLLL